MLYVDIYEPLMIMLRPMRMLAQVSGRAPLTHAFRGATKASPDQLELDLDLGPGLRVCDLGAICALELFRETEAPADMRRYDDGERVELKHELGEVFA